MEINSFPIITKLFEELDPITDAQATDADGVLFFDESVGVMKRMTRGELFKGKVIPIDSVAQLAGIDTTGFSERQQFNMGSFAPDGESGGGAMLWEPDLPKSLHDGVQYFSPTVPAPADFNNPTDVQSYKDGAGEEWPAGFGIFVLDYAVSRAELEAVQYEIDLIDLKDINIVSDIPALSLPVGFRLTTKGCLSIGDGGHGTFIVTDVEPAIVDGYSVILMANGNWAVLQPVNDFFLAEQFGARGIPGNSDRISIQAAINAAAEIGAAVLLTKAQYDIDSSGLLTGGKLYGIMLPSNTKLISFTNSQLRALGNEEFDIVVTDKDAVPNSENITISNIVVDGDSLNRTANTSVNLALQRVNGLKINNVISKNSTSFGWRIQACDRVDIIYSGSDQVDASETNADGMHFIDCDNVTGSGIRIITDSDDGFVIEAINKDISNYLISGLYTKAKGRGIAMFVDETLTTISRKMSNIKINGIAQGCQGPAIALTEASFNAVDIDVIATGCEMGLGLKPGTSVDSGIMENCNFKVRAIDCIETGFFSVVTTGEYRNNNIDISIVNPGDGFNGGQLQGYGWTGKLHCDYDPDGTKVSPGSGLLINCSDSSLEISARGGTNAVIVQSGADNNAINIGRISGGLTNSLLLDSGATGNSFTGGVITGTVLNNSGGTNKFSGTIGATYSGTTTLAPDGSGDVIIPHNLGNIPSIYDVGVASSMEIIATVVSRSATTVTARLRFASTFGVVTTGSYAVSYDIRI